MSYKYKRWTAEEDEYLKNHYPTATPEELEKVLKRKYTSIQVRANRKGYKKINKNKWTEEKTKYLNSIEELNYHCFYNKGIEMLWLAEHRMHSLHQPSETFFPQLFQCFLIHLHL